MAPLSLWVRATLALVAVAIALVPVGLAALRLQQDADAADLAALRSARVLDEVRALDTGVLEQSTALRGGAAGDAAVGRAQAVAARSALAADAPTSGMDAQLAPLLAAADAWLVWAAVGPAAGESAGRLGDGEALLARFQAAASDAEALAAARAERTLAVAGQEGRAAQVASVAGPVVGSAPLPLLGLLLLWVALRPVRRLARTANRLAGGLDPQVPYARRPGELGKVARALLRWRRAAASQRLIWQHSPVAMLVFGADLRIQQVNPAELVMFRADPVRFTDEEYMRSIVSRVTHPDDARATARMYRRLIAGESDTERLEKRYIRSDDTVFWGDVTLTLVRDDEGRPDHYVAMIEDVTERREEVERAVGVQRNLLPPRAPDLPGYEVAGLCHPSREMSGDFYDWQVQESGRLVLTLGDVMGKDMPAALLTVTTSIALRTAAAQAGVGEAVRSVAAATVRDLERAEAFVTLFHALLDPASGALTYVDAGHGLAVVVGNGEVRMLEARARSLPLGVLDGEEYREAVTTLAPGDALLVFSDGVLDVHPELEGRLDRVAELIAGAASAGDMAERLAIGPGTARDDVTVLVLVRRGPEAGSEACLT